MSVKSTRYQASQLGKAACGDMYLKVYPQSNANSADLVEDHAVGTFTVDLEYRLESADGQLHSWFTGDAGLTLVATEVVTDAQVGVPTISDASPLFVEGIARVTITYLTDAVGNPLVVATKEYALGDVVTVDPTMADIMGYGVDVSAAQYKDTFIA